MLLACICLLPPPLRLQITFMRNSQCALNVDVRTVVSLAHCTGMCPSVCCLIRACIVRLCVSGKNVSALSYYQGAGESHRRTINVIHKCTTIAFTVASHCLTQPIFSERIYPFSPILSRVVIWLCSGVTMFWFFTGIGSHTFNVNDQFGSHALYIWTFNWRMVSIWLSHFQRVSRWHLEAWEHKNCYDSQIKLYPYSAGYRSVFRCQTGEMIWPISLDPIQHDVLFNAFQFRNSNQLHFRRSHSTTALSSIFFSISFIAPRIQRLDKKKSIVLTSTLRSNHTSFIDPGSQFR